MKIDWKLKNGEEVIINEIDKAAKYEDNIIYYVDEYGTHVIDRNNRIYERRCPEDIFRVDFNNNLLTVIFENNNLKYDINTKYEEAINKHIVFVFKVNDLSNIKMEDEDLVVILANLLNNAIEACENCIGKKVIKFKFMMEEQMIILSVKNTCNQMIIYHNNEIATTKMINQDEHGVGIKNIIRIVEKYNGEYVIQNDEDQFYFSIIIPL